MDFKHTEEEFSASISIRDSYLLDYNYTLWGRIKNAVRHIFKKPVDYNDIYINDPFRLRMFAIAVEESTKKSTSINIKNGEILL